MRRNDLGISAEILQICKSAALKTQIVYQANLNFKIVVGYLDRLIKNGQLVQNGRFYFTTDKGEEFLMHYEMIAPPELDVMAHNVGY